MLKQLSLSSLAIVLLLSFSAEVYAQDPQFTQFYANPLYLNPALAGTSHCPRLSLNHRDQWSSISGTFVTTSASYDQHLDVISGGVGVMAWRDVAGEGTLTTNHVSGVYSYQISINRKFSLKVGAQASWQQKSVDWSRLTFGDMIDPRRGFIYSTNEPTIAEPTSYVDFSAGILGFSEKYFVGFAVNHLAEPNESVISGASPLPRKYTFHAGGMIPLDGTEDGVSISPNLLVQAQQDFLQINLGMYYARNPLMLGLWYRTSVKNGDSFIALVGFQTGIFKVGYSYDYTVSKLGRTGGSHEISLGIQFDCKPKKKKFRTISCPSF